MANAFDAIVVGAGPAGSSAAILLARAGWSVALVEKHSFPRRKVCGECVAASNLPLLEALGVGRALELGGGRVLRKMALLHGHQAVQADLPRAAHEKFPWGLAIGRKTLDTVLLDRARQDGVHIFQPWALNAVQGTAGNWRGEIRTANSRDSLSLTAPVLIDAHGSWEKLRSTHSSPRRLNKGSDMLAFKANFSDSGHQQQQISVLAFQGGYGGMVVDGRGLCTVACCIRRDRLEECRSLLAGRSAGEVVEIMLSQQCAGVRSALRGATRVGGWLSAGPLDPAVRLRPDDAIYRIGNAAGEAHPIIGEGMSMALQSAWLLCLQLLGGGQQLNLSDTDWQRRVGVAYERQWRRHFAARFRIAATFAHIAMRPLASPALVAAARLWPGLLTVGAGCSGKA